MTTRPAERYGATPPWQRRVTLVLAALASTAALGWIAWAVWFHGNPEVQSEVVTWEVRSDQEVAVTVQVDVRDGVDATCTVRVFAEDHTSVGVLAFAPTDGRNDVVVRTERRATSVDEPACTTPDQPRPR